ncbi:hypothetical protein BJY04DRAFT_230284 [Aspergillus karnatakaensis]|uniref:uncharacterized protein n=1 Tax=Aspergillus karnatakaensis TaxID=1810916 RepID=UPI003CCD19E3
MSPNVEVDNTSSLARLTWDLYNLCYFVSESAPDDLHELITEPVSFQGLLRSLHDSAASNSSSEDPTEADQDLLRHSLQTCLHALQRLEQLVAEFRDLASENGSQMQHNIEKATRRTEIEKLQAALTVQCADLRSHVNPLASVIGMTQNLETPMTIKAEEGSDYPWSSFRANPRCSISDGSRISEHSNDSSATLFMNNLNPISPLSIRASPVSPLIPETNTRPEIPIPTSLEEQHPPPPEKYLHLEDGFVAEKEAISPAYAVTKAVVPRPRTQLRDLRLASIRCEPRDSFHQPDHATRESFEIFFNNEEQAQRLDTSGLLRLVVWWLLRARAALANCERPTLVNARGNMSPSTTSSTYSNQAYVDLLKASWILYDAVIARQSFESLTLDENRKLISDLSDEFSQFLSADVPESTSIKLRNLDIWEPIQPEEITAERAEAALDQCNSRYITVEMEDAGSEAERVLLRTFINAGIGGKKSRMRTKGAPYMLLLSTSDGDSEPKLILCNQSGTMCLQRDFTTEDLAELTRISNASLSAALGVKISEPVSLKFDSTPISVSFQYGSDLGQFINTPKAYFDSVSQREPVDSDQFSESVIFKTSVESSMNPPVVTRSCEVRILERTFEEVWQSVRRMVITSSIAESSPKCHEFFMPLSRVQIHRAEDSRFVQIKWSDTSQERSDKTDGSYNTTYSYQQAEDFEAAVLGLTSYPTLSWSQPSCSGVIYDVADAAADQKQYKAVLLFSTRLSFKYGDLYYLYRDTDYIYDSATLKAATTDVSFSHCEKKIGTTEVLFTNEPTLRAFMSSLASSYKLTFSRRADTLTTKKKQPFLNSHKSSKGETEVQVWRRENSTQLAARWTADIPDRWLTMSVPSGSGKGISRDNNRVEFPVTDYIRGTVLNLAIIAAGSPKDPRMARRSGPIAISFKKTKDRDDFIAALGSQS